MSHEHHSSEEIQRALRRCWQPVARIQDLANGPRRAVLLGEPLAVFVTERGTPAVVSDRCAHRGASLSMGAVAGEGIQCPYHGWEWNGAKGHCTRIPSLLDQSQIPPRARIPSCPALEQWGLVWTCLDSPFGELPRLSWLTSSEWRLGLGEPFDLPVSFGVMIENFRDVAHFAFVHRATMGEISQVVEPLEVHIDDLEVTMERAMTVGQGADKAWNSLRGIRYHTIAPNLASAQLAFADGSERCMIQVGRAVNASESVHYWIVGISPDYHEYEMAEVIEFEAQLYREDEAVILTVTSPELPLESVEDSNTLADSFTLAYRRSFAQFVDRACATE